jgi:hypothetical protein
MPTYQIKAPDGNTYRIEGPEGASQEQIAMAVMAQNPEAGIPPKAPTEYAGFFGSMKEAAGALGAADEAAAFAANPTEENRKALIEASKSKYKSADFGLSPTEDLSTLGRNWEALKEMAGGSLGFLAAPAAAATTGAVVGGGIGAPVAGYGVAAAQYGVQNIARQAQEQQAAIEAGRAPEELSLGKAALATVGQTALDVGAGKVFGSLLSRFPLLKNLAIGGKSAEESVEVLADAVRKGKLEIPTKGAVARGVGKGIAFEAPQEVAQQALEMWQAGVPVDQWRDELIQAGVGGALLGGPLGGVEAKYAAPRKQLEERKKRAFDLLVEKYTKQGVTKEQAAAQAREDIQTGNINFEEMKLLGYSPTTDYIVTPEGVSRLAADYRETPEKNIVDAEAARQEQDAARKQQEVLQQMAGVSAEEIAAARESTPYESGRQGFGFMHLLPEEEEAQGETTRASRYPVPTTFDALKSLITRRVKEGLLDPRQAVPVLEAKTRGIKAADAGRMLNQIIAENEDRGALPLIGGVSAVTKSNISAVAQLKQQVKQHLDNGLIDERQAQNILGAHELGISPNIAGTLLNTYVAENNFRKTSPTPLERNAQDQAEYARLQQEEAAAEEQKRLQQTRAVDEDTARAQAERTQQIRRGALTRALESRMENVQRRSMEGSYDPYGDIETAFSKELKQEGVPNIAPTEEERGYIAGAVRLALSKEPDNTALQRIPETVIGERGVEELESFIPERKEPVTEPSQLSFPGMGRNKTIGVQPKTTVAEEPKPDITLTKDLLDEIGVAEKNNFTSRVLGADLRKAVTDKPLSDPGVQEALVNYTKNKNVSAITRTNIEQLLGRLAPEQGELFAPEGRRDRPYISKESVEAQRMRTVEGQKVRTVPEADKRKINSALTSLNELSNTRPDDIVPGANVSPELVTPLLRNAKDALRTQWNKRIDAAIAALNVARNKMRFMPDFDVEREELAREKKTKLPPTTFGVAEEAAAPASMNDLQSILTTAQDAVNIGDVEEARAQLDSLKEFVNGASWETLFDVNPEFESAETGRRTRLSDYTGEKVQTRAQIEQPAAKAQTKIEKPASPGSIVNLGEADFLNVFKTKQPWLNKKRALAFLERARDTSSITKKQHAFLVDGVNNGAKPHLQVAAAVKYALLEEGHKQRDVERAGAKDEATRGAVANVYSPSGQVRYRRSYTRAKGMAAGDVITTVNELIKDWKSNLNIEVVQSVNNLPKNLAAQVAVSGAGNVKGLAVRDGNTVFVVADNLSNAGDVAATLFHEALGHAGLARAFGAQLNKILRAVYNTNPAYKQKADAWLAANEDAYADEKDRELRALEEVLAEESEQGRINPSILARIKAAIKDFARKIGLNLSYTDADVAAILSSAHDVVVKGGKNRSANLQEIDKKVAFKVEKAAEVQEKITRSRNAEKLAESPAKLADMFRDFNKSKAFLTDNWNSLDIPATQGVLAMASTSDIRGIYGSRLPSITKLDRIEFEHNQARGRMHTALDDFVKKVWQPFVNENPVAGDILADLLRASAMVQYDPRKPKAKPSGAERFVQGLYNELGKTAGGHALYGKIIDSGKADLNKEVDALFETVKNEDLPGSIKDPATPKGALYEYVKGIRDKVASLEVHFPESRFGPYTLAIGSEEDGNLEVYMRENRQERDRLRNALEAELRANKDPRINTVRMYDTPKEARDNISRDSTKELNKIHAMLGGGNVGPATIEALKDAAFQLYMRTLPQTAALKDLEQRRKDITGGSVDVIRGYAAHKYSANNRLARMVYGPQLRNAVAEVKQEADKVSDPQEKLRLNTVAGELNKRVNRAIDPRFTDDEFQNGMDKLARLGSKAVFYNFLSSPKQFVVQFATLPMIAAPVLAARYNVSIPGMLTHLGQHLRLDRKELSLFNRDYSASRMKDPGAAKAFKTVYDGLSAGGFFDDGRIAEAAAISKKPQIGGSAAAQAMRKVDHVLRFAFQTAESSVRKVIFATTFEFEYAKAKKEGKSPQEAMDTARINAVEATYKTAFNYSIWNRPRLFTSNPILRTATQFMIFPLAMSSLLVESFHQYALSPLATVEEKRAAAKQFWGIMGMTGIFGGLTGLPMYAAITAVLDAYAKYLDDDDDDDDTNPLYKKNSDLWIKEWLIPNLFGSGSGLAKTLGLSEDMNKLLDRSLKYGPVSALTGLNITSSTSAADLPFMFFIDKDVSNEGLEAAFYDTMLGPTGALIKNYINGVKDMAKGDYIRGTEQFLPSAIKAPVTALRYASEGNVARSGREVRGAEYYNAGRLLLQSLGFADTATYEKENALFEAAKTGYDIKEEKNALYDALDVAYRKGGMDSVRKMYQKDIVNGFNKRYPTLRISPDDVIKSIEGRALERAQSKLSAGLNIGPRGFDRWEREIMGKYAE